MTSTSDVHISGTSTDPAVRASVVIADEADKLLLAYQAQAALVTELHLDGARRQESFTGLMDFVADHLRPYLAATDRVLYAAAAGATGTRLLVRVLRRIRESLVRHADELGRAGTSDQAVTAAHALGVELAACVDIERSILLPALVELPGADLPGLAADLRTVRHA